MENVPDFSKAYSPRKALKITRGMYKNILDRLEALEKAEKKEPRKRRTKAEIEADKAKEEE